MSILYIDTIFFLSSCRYFVFTEINNHRRDSVVLHGQATNKVFTTMWSNVVQISYCYGNKAPTTDDDWRLKFTVKGKTMVKPYMQVTKIT